MKSTFGTSEYSKLKDKGKKKLGEIKKQIDLTTTDTSRDETLENAWQNSKKVELKQIKDTVPVIIWSCLYLLAVR